MMGLKTVQPKLYVGFWLDAVVPGNPKRRDHHDLDGTLSLAAIGSRQMAILTAKSLSRARSFGHLLRKLHGCSRQAG